MLGDGKLQNTEGLIGRLRLSSGHNVLWVSRIVFGGSWGLKKDGGLSEKMKSTVAGKLAGHDPKKELISGAKKCRATENVIKDLKSMPWDYKKEKDLKNRLWWLCQQIVRECNAVEKVKELVSEKGRSDKEKLMIMYHMLLPRFQIRVNINNLLET